MSKHKRIIGYSWIVIGVVIAIVSLLSLNNASAQQLPMRVIVSVTALCSLYILAGYLLLSRIRRAYWLCIPFSLLTLPNFPIGTFLSGYYLWYFFKHERPQLEEKS